MWGRTTDRVVDRRRRSHTFNPTQGVSAVIGIAALVLGLAALITTGLNTADWTRPHDEILGLHHTPALAVGEIGFGVLMLLAAMTTFAGRVVSALLTTALLVFGIFVVADFRRARLHDALGVHDNNGWLFVVVGGIGFLTAVMMPVVRTTRTTSIREREVPAPVEDRVHDDDVDDHRERVLAHETHTVEDTRTDHAADVSPAEPVPVGARHDDPRTVRDESEDATETRHRGLFHRRSRTERVTS